MENNTKSNEKEKMSIYEKAVNAPFVITYVSIIIFYISMIVISAIMWIAVFTGDIIISPLAIEIICSLGFLFFIIFMPISIIIIIALRIFSKFSHKHLFLF